MRKIFVILSIVIIFVSACGAEDTSAPTEQGEPEEVVTTETEDYTPIEEVFSSAFPDAEVSAKKEGTRIAVYILSDLSAEEPPAGWEDIISDLSAALETTHDMAAEYGAATVSVQLEAPDETILASGFNGKIQFDFFNQEEIEDSNPPTITQFEFEQISVGMTLTEVQDIIGGPGKLESEIGSAGSSTGSVRTYRWEGTGDTLSYAVVLFDDYSVYSKMDFGLE